eukprot:4104752-Prymnesium_polylepis.1
MVYVGGSWSLLFNNKLNVKTQKLEHNIVFELTLSTSSHGHGHGQRPCAEAAESGSRVAGWRSPPWHAVSSAD